MIYNQKGFGLPAMILAGTMMSVIGLGVTNMMNSNAKTIYYLEDKSAVLELKNLITMQLSDQSACGNSFSNVNFSSGVFSVESIRDKNNNPIFQNASNYDRISIGNMRLENNNLPIVVSSTGLVDLIVPITRQRGNQAVASIKIPIQVLTTAIAPVRVDKCVALGNGANLNSSMAGCPVASSPVVSGGARSTINFSKSATDGYYPEGTTCTNSRVSGPEGREDYSSTKYLCINGGWATL